MALGLSGISYLLSQGPVFSLGISLAGGTWLLYMGITAIPKQGPAQLNGESSYLQNLVSTKAAFLHGLGINLLNPKAFLYFVGLFSVLLGPQIPLPKRLAALLLMLMAQSIAFSLVAILLPDPRRNRPWLNAQWLFQLLFSLIFTGLGLWMWVRAAEHILSLY
jgi:threonine/homoserine/homoserine lactone efflux protein